VHWDQFEDVEDALQLPRALTLRHCPLRALAPLQQVALLPQDWLRQPQLPQECPQQALARLPLGPLEQLPAVRLVLQLPVLRPQAQASELLESLLAVPLGPLLLRWFVSDDGESLLSEFASERHLRQYLT